MLKYLILFTAVFCLVQSQRPWHAGSGNRLPAVLPQYLDEQAAALAAQASQTVQPDQVQGNPAIQAGAAVTTVQAIANRIDGIDTVEESVVPDLNIITSTITPILINLPVDAKGDVDLVNRIMTWPREKQPFWFLNWQAIQAHRGDTDNMAQPVQIQPISRSFFTG